MRRVLAFASWFLVLPALAAGQECAKTSYGAGVTLAESTPIATLLEAPDEWVGEQVRVEGVIAEVCEMAGCWLELRAADGDRVVKVKVEDGEIVFPVSARGKTAVAQGTFERLEFDRESFVVRARHEAQEKGSRFDESSIGDGPFRAYQIAGSGAEICR